MFRSYDEFYQLIRKRLSAISFSALFGKVKIELPREGNMKSCSPLTLKILWFKSLCIVAIWKREYIKASLCNVNANTQTPLRQKKHISRSQRSLFNDIWRGLETPLWTEIFSQRPKCNTYTFCLWYWNSICWLWKISMVLMFLNTCRVTSSWQWGHKKVLLWKYLSISR